MTYLLWIVQILMALLFLFAGGTKLFLPLSMLQSMGSPNQIQFPGLFIRFIGLVEVLGAIGLILPVLLRIKPSLTPLAALGLVIIMIGAMVIGLITDGIGAAVVPIVVGLLLVFVAYGRWKLAPAQARA